MTSEPRAVASFPQSIDLTVLMQRGVFGLAGLTLFLMALGGMTRVMNAGLSCPDWPLCYGSVVPANMDSLIFWEWFHRVIATTVGFLTLGMVGLSWWGRKQLPNWLPWAALGALGLVLVQGILGGLTVTQFLRFDIVTAHLGTATLFLGLLMTIGVCLFPAPTLLTPVGPLTWVGPLAALVTYGQLVLGGLVASQWALHQCIGDQALCAVMNNHLWGVAPTLSMVALTLIVTWAKVPWGSPIAWSAMGALLLVCLQIGLGIGTYLLQLSIPVVTVLHLITGVSLFASLVVTSTLALRSQS